MGDLKVAVCSSALGVDDALWTPTSVARPHTNQGDMIRTRDALAIEVGEEIDVVEV